MPLYRVATTFHGGLKVSPTQTASAGDLVEVDEAFAAAAGCLVPEAAAALVPDPPAPPADPAHGDAPPDPAPTPDAKGKSKKNR